MEGRAELQVQNEGMEGGLERGTGGEGPRKRGGWKE